MIGDFYEEQAISEMTLALFEDSHWYKVNYYTGGLFRYGKNETYIFTDLFIPDGTESTAGFDIFRR